MPTVNYHTLPIFEADQVLTSDHLNDLVNFLFEQERLTRSRLIGIGPVCGLQVRRTNDGRIAISNGIGISSQGHLLQLEAETGNESIYGFRRPYSDPNDPDYSFFQAGETARELWELLPVKTESADALPADLSPYGVLLYLECFERRLKNCLQNDCDEKGSQWEFTVRPLLVELDDLREIICEEEQLDTPKSEAQITDLMLGRYLLPQLSLDRFRPGNVGMFTFQDLVSHYRSLIEGTLPNLQQALRASYDKLVPLLQPEYGSDTVFRQAIDRLSERYKEISANRPSLLQYFHAMLCDLVEAYAEFRHCVFDLLSECCPPAGRYPKHLRLGHLGAAGDCLPSPYRTLFHYAPIHEGQGPLRSRVIGLHRRLLLLLTRFEDPVNLARLRITPSRELDRPLSERAIPYYYQVDEELLRRWNPDLARRCRHRETLSYHAVSYDPAADEITRDPLRFSLKPYDFLRIEGHHGRNYRTALTSILTERKRNNLPFDVVALKLSRSAAGTEAPDIECLFNDLEVMCNAWREDLACRLKSVVGQLGKASVAGSLKANAVPATTSTTTSGGSSAVSNFAGLAGGTFARTSVANQPFATIPVHQVAKAVSSAIPRDPEGELIGTYVYQALQDAEDNPEIAATLAVNDLRKRDDINQLKTKDFQLAYEMPIQIMATSVALAKQAESPCSDIDLDELEKLQARLQQLMQTYIVLLTQFESDNEDFEVLVQAGAIIQITNLFLSSCSLEQLKVILTEMARRKQQLLEMNLFHRYLDRHPGMDHAGGVPKGGTFILVYYGRDRQVAPGPGGFRVAGQVVDVEGQGLPGATVLAEGTTTGTITDTTGNFQLQMPAGAFQLRAYSVGFSPILREVLQPANNLVLTLGGPNEQPTPVLPQDGEVVADFFLPYLCCSDCPPIDYIIQQVPTEEPVGLRLQPRTFCQDPNSPAEPVDFVVSPADGTVEGDGVEQTNAGFVFNPMAVELSEEVPYRTISFTVNGQPVPATAEVELMITADFSLEFFWRPNEATGAFEYVLQLFNQSSPWALTFSWEVFLLDDNGNEILLDTFVSTNLESIERTYNDLKPEVEFHVRLRAQSRFCEATVQQGPFQVEEIPGQISFLLRAEEEEEPIDPPIVMTADTRNFLLEVRPEQGELQPASRLQLPLRELSPQGGARRYRFNVSDGQVQPAVYTYRYSTESGRTATYAITVRRNFVIGSGNLTSLLANTNRNMALVEDLSARPGSDDAAELTARTLALLNRIRSEAETSDGSDNLRSGENAEELAAELQEVTVSTARGIRSSTDVQNRNKLTELLGIQTRMTIDLISARDEDISRTDELSKLLTVIGREFRRLGGERETRGAAERLRTSLSRDIRRLDRSKPNARSRVAEVIESLRT